MSNEPRGLRDSKVDRLQFLIFVFYFLPERQFIMNLCKSQSSSDLKTRKTLEKFTVHLCFLLCMLLQVTFFCKVARLNVGLVLSYFQCLVSTTPNSVLRSSTMKIYSIPHRPVNSSSNSIFMIPIFRNLGRLGLNAQTLRQITVNISKCEAVLFS